ncbi:glycosyl hydrolase 53 family protein [Hymenobacter metallilatus]|uniref:Arabinogalactan endo-beta-1,4-galactanase n=1 Tax=Hymenobacter metallilatus TaxID=2493666 RepID=A0A428JLM2_9BACT|nr:glycosyl hydrolase 53 family protein [Hymenobacter metallilatus]RSK33885.1 T9SS C-terminal target domain-containing protein [Hymenobacter metallilatus]
MLLPILPPGLRRTLLLLTLLGGGLLRPSTADAQTFAKGGDTSWLQQMEANNYLFYNDQGVQQDCFQILKDKGINSIRLRVWVNPSMVDWVNGHCSPAEVVTMATRAKNLGFRIMIDFHYSDSWADPGQQTKPAAWANHSFAQLLTDVYDHTYTVLSSLRANGVTPEWVQVGNEIPGGMLWPEGSTANFGQLTQLINKGYDAVKAASPTSKVVVHLDKGNDNARFRWFFDQLTANGGRYDVIGMSYYPYWLNQDYTVSIGSLQANLRDMASRYGKEVVVAEVGGDCANAPQNVYDMLVAVQNAVFSVPNGKGLGVFYWEPQGYRSFSGYQLSAWNSNGRPTSALNAFLVTPTSPPPVTNFVVNPGFEADGAATQTPAGWTSWASTAANYAADYTETNGQASTYRLTHWLAGAYQVSTYQLITGLPSGTYTLRAWVMNGGGQTACQLYAKNFGGTEKNLSLPVAATWTQVQIPGIQVTNGQCEIGLWSNANAGNWCSLDNVELLPAAVTGISKATAASRFEVYPNPATQELRFAHFTGPATARIYSPTGQLLLTQQLTAAHPLVNVSGLAAGLYEVRLEEAGRASTRKFVKQ